MVDASALLVELKGLRRGRGIYSPNVRDAIGFELRSVCDVAPDDPILLVREKLVARLGEIANTLPEEFRVGCMVALAIHPEARQLLLQDRLDWFAEYLTRDGRTARRRVDEGLRMLADVASASRPSNPRLPDGSAPGWYMESFSALVRLDLQQVQAHERRVIVAERDFVEEINLAVSVPGTGVGDSDELRVDVEFGGTLIRRPDRTGDRVESILLFPQALSKGSRHEYGVTYRLPEGRPILPHYILTPARRCDVFELRVRFDRAHVPRKVWRVESGFRRWVDDVQPTETALAADAAGEIYTEFSTLSPGLGYGARWQM